MEVVGYIGHYDQARAISGLRERVDSTGLWLTQVSPFWYTISSTGTVVKQSPSVDDSPAAVSAIKSHGVRLVPAIGNKAPDGLWSAALVSKVFSNPSTMGTLVTSITNLVRGRGYDGIDIDFENCVAEDRDNMTQFVKRLAKSLHQYKKTVSVTVQPKSQEPGHRPAQNYAALGSAADEFRVMLYDHHYPSGPPGAISPMNWVRRIAEWTITQVNPSRVVLGFATYGYDWPSTGLGKTVMHDDLVKTAQDREATIYLDPLGDGCYFHYGDHEVWFENSASLKPKIELARQLGVRGIHFWRLGGDDSNIWK